MRLTSSAIEKAESCAFPFRDGTAFDDGPTHPKTQDGIDMHALIAACLDGVVDAVPHATPRGRELYAVWARWWPEFAGSRWWHSETPVAFDVATRRARRLASKGQRDYSDAGPTELAGTIDVHCWDKGDGLVAIGDWKSGNVTRITPARRNKQLAFGALSIARLYKLERATVFLAHVSEAGVMVDAHDLDDIDLDATEAEVCALFAALPTAQPKPWRRADPGQDHCRWCACRRAGACPEVRA